MSRSSFIQRRHPRLLSQDSFLRADSSTSLGSTNGPGSLDPLTWTANGGVFGISSNQAYNVSATVFNTNAIVDLQQSDVELRFKFTNTNGQIGIVFRWSNSSNYWNVLSNAGAPGTFLRKHVAGVDTIVATSTRYADNAICTVVMVGSTITIYRDQNIAIGPVTDSFNQTATKHGMLTNNDHGVRWDNWQAYSLVG